MDAMDEEMILPDEPFWRMSRLWGAWRKWFWFNVVLDPPVEIPLRVLIRTHRRPWAAGRNKLY